MATRSSILKKVQTEAQSDAPPAHGLKPVTVATVGLDSRNVGLVGDVTEEKVAKVTQALMDSTLERLDRCTEIEPFAEAIGLRWNAATYNFYVVGRLLAKARVKLEPRDFDMMLEERLPFGTSVANKLLQFFFAVEQGFIPMNRLDCLPANYDSCYRIALVARKDQQAVAEAFEHNVITPKITPKDLKAYVERRKLPHATPLQIPDTETADKADGTDEPQNPRVRLAQIVEKRKALERRIAEDKKTLAELRQEEAALRRAVD